MSNVALTNGNGVRTIYGHIAEKVITAVIVMFIAYIVGNNFLTNLKANVIENTNSIKKHCEETNLALMSKADKSKLDAEIKRSTEIDNRTLLTIERFCVRQEVMIDDIKEIKEAVKK